MKGQFDVVQAVRFGSPESDLIRFVKRAEVRNSGYALI